MNKIFENVKDKYVRGTYIYKKIGDTKAYADEACTIQLTTSELTDIFLKGAVVNAAGVLYKPTALKTVSGIATITYVTADTSTATTAVLATLVSKADEAAET